MSRLVSCISSHLNTNHLKFTFNTEESFGLLVQEERLQVRGVGDEASTRLQDAGIGGDHGTELQSGGKILKCICRADSYDSVSTV